MNKSGGAVDALDDAEYSGSVISLIENGEAFIKSNCKMKWRKTANSREEMPEYVERSYHEALVNALAHRDYLVMEVKFILTYMMTEWKSILREECRTDP